MYNKNIRIMRTPTNEILLYMMRIDFLQFVAAKFILNSTFN